MSKKSETNNPKNTKDEKDSIDILDDMINQSNEEVEEVDEEEEVNHEVKYSDEELLNRINEFGETESKYGESGKYDDKIVMLVDARPNEDFSPTRIQKIIDVETTKYFSDTLWRLAGSKGKTKEYIKRVGRGRYCSLQRFAQQTKD